MSLLRPDLDAIFRKTEGRCAYCGRDLESHCLPLDRESHPWLVDLWIPESALGPTAHELANVWPACRSCCEEKGKGNGWDYVMRRRERARPVHPLADVFIDEVGDWFTAKLFGRQRLWSTTTARWPRKNR